MKKSFEKKGIGFEVEVINKNVRVTAKGITTLANVYFSSRYGYWVYDITEKRLSKALGISGGRVLLADDSAREVHDYIETIEAAEKAAEAQELEDIRQNKITITVRYRDGEYLSGYQAFGNAAEALEELGAAKEVSGWGCHVNNDLVKSLGTEFTYAQAQEYMRPATEEKAAKEAAGEAEKAAKFAEARETGKPVEISSMAVECDGSVEECSTDIITVYAMPDGSTRTERVHTY